MVEMTRRRSWVARAGGVLAAGAAAAAAAMTASGQTGPLAQAGETREVLIVAERFSFTPSEITVEQGTRLKLRIRSEDTAHGFHLIGQDVDLVIPKRGRGEVEVTFEATEAGEFEFECSKLCGAGHAFMRGAIVVRPRGTEGGSAAPASAGTSPEDVR